MVLAQLPSPYLCPIVKFLTVPATIILSSGQPARAKLEMSPESSLIATKGA
jgi:hypothetical protein